MVNYGCYPQIKKNNTFKLIILPKMRKIFLSIILIFLSSCENEKTIQISSNEKFKLQIIRSSKSDDYTGGILEFDLKGFVQQIDTLFLEIHYPNGMPLTIEFPLDSGIVKSHHIEDWYSDKAIFYMKYNPNKKGDIILSYKYY